MKTNLKILILEDSATDTELIQRLLKKEKMNCEFCLAMNKSSFLKALEEFSPDVILSDNSLPQFNATEALNIARQQLLNIPFILVTGTVSDEFAANIIKAGADDYILKDRLQRLPTAIEAALQKKKSQIAIQHGEETRKLIMNSALDAIICINTTGAITVWTPQAEKMFGWKEEEVIGKKLTETIIPEQYRKRHIEGFSRYLETGEGPVLNKVIEMTALNNAGSEFPVELVIVPIKQNDDDFFCAFIRDITERKKAEEQLSRERNLLRALIDNLPDYIYVKDKESRYIITNRAFIKLAGATSEADTIGKKVTDLFNEKVGKVNMEEDRGVLELGEEIIDREEPSIIYKGEERWLLTTKVPLRDKGKNITGILGISKDITERKKADELVKESNKRYEFANKATQDTIWEWDYHTKKGKWGEGIMTTFGYSENKLNYGENWMDEFVHPEDKERILKDIRDRIEHNLQNCQNEYRFRCADGSYKYVFDRGYILYDENKRPYRMIGAMTDITETKRLERQLAEQQIKQHKLITETIIQTQEKERNELGRELHDNINQILATIKMYLGMVKAKANISVDLVGQSYEYVTEAMKEIRKLSHSLVAPSLGTIGLEEALQGLVEEADLSNNLQVQLLFDEKYNEQDIDKNKELMFYRIVQEQMNNIIKYAKANKAVISFKTDHEGLVLSVADDGVGFDVTQKSKGIGLRNIGSRVEFYSGQMNIISAPGQGCTLEVFIPC